MTSDSNPRIPSPVCAVVGEVLGNYYSSHTKLETAFAEHGAPGDPPAGNMTQKGTAWLKRASADQSVDALAVLGGVLEDFMESDLVRFNFPEERLSTERKRVVETLARHGLTYHPGGRIISATAGVSTRSLEAVLRARDVPALHAEFERAMNTLETDPAAAITAACAAVESFCKIYIGDEGLELPKDQTIKPLWKVVQQHLGLDPAQVADDDMKRMLQGLASVVDGLGALRTHIGSAHGRGRGAFEPTARHARLAVSAAHSLLTFAIETWDAEKGRSR